MWKGEYMKFYIFGIVFTFGVLLALSDENVTNRDLGNMAYDDRNGNWICYKCEQPIDDE